MDLPTLIVSKQLVKYQRVWLLPQTPEHHQDDDLQIIQGNRATWHNQSAIQYDLSHPWRQNASRLQEPKKPKRLRPNMLQLHARVDSNAGVCRIDALILSRLR